MISLPGADFNNLSSLCLVLQLIENQKLQLEMKVKAKTRALNERVKELYCLYGISKLVEKEHTTEDILQRAVRLIPPTWRYPEVTCAQITFADRSYRSDNFRKTRWRQSQKITVSGENAGAVEVYYLEEKRLLDEGPFSKEERDLIDAIAEMLGHIIGRRQAEQKLEKKVLYDSLTGLPNRQLFHNRQKHAIEAAPRSKALLGVFLLDIDGFKHVNDRLGHQAGDDILKDIAVRLKGCIRQSDTLARLGGG